MNSEILFLINNIDPFFCRSLAAFVFDVMLQIFTVMFNLIDEQFLLHNLIGNAVYKKGNT